MGFISFAVFYFAFLIRFYHIFLRLSISLRQTFSQIDFQSQKILPPLRMLDFSLPQSYM